MCFSVNFAKFLKTLFLIEHLRWLFLFISQFFVNVFLYFNSFQYSFCSTEAVIWRCSIKSALQNFAKFTGKHLCKSLFWQYCRQRPATLLKYRLRHWCFPVGFTKFYRTSFLQKISTRQLLAVTNTRLRWKERKHWWKMHNRQRCIQNPAKHLRQNFWWTY